MSVRSPFYIVPVLVGVFALLFVGTTAYAHVTVSPSEVESARYQTFTVNVPNEKDILTTTLKITIPKELKYVTPTQKTGWEIVTEKGEGDDSETVRSITWSNGSIGKGLRDEFSFSAKVPDNTGEIQWKAYQTYADGTLVSWDQKEQAGSHKEAMNSGPFSVTKVVAESGDTGTENHSVASLDAKTAADRSFILSIAALLVALVSLFYATRKK